jgi:serine/threonine-protein kinase
MAAAYARKGSESRARRCIEELSRLAERQYVTPLAEAFAAIGIGDQDLAFQRLKEAIEHKTNFVNLVAVEPFFDPLRSDGRFSGLLKTLSLPCCLQAAENTKPSALNPAVSLRGAYGSLLP